MFPQNNPSRRWGRVFSFVGIGTFFFAGIAYISASFLLNRYLHGEAFRTLLNEKTAAFLGTDGEYMPIQCNGFSFYSDSYAAREKAGAFKELRADQIRADFEPGAIFQGAWQVNNLQIQRVKVVLGDGITPTYPSSALSTVTPLQAEPPRASGWIPNRFNLQHARIEEVNLVWSPPGREGSLRQMRLTLEPSGRDLLATGYSGVLQQAGWPALNVDHIKLRCRYPDLFITDSLFQLGDSQNFTVSGIAGLKSQAVDLQVKCNGVSISPYLPVDWRASVKGLVNGEAQVTGSLRDAEGLKVIGGITLTGGQVEALPILEKIAAFTRTQQFRQFTLQKADAIFSWTKAKLVVNRVMAESEGLIRLEGGFVVENGYLEGTFQLGVSPASLRWLPGSRSRVFTEDHDGYVWTPLKVSGPVDHLTEDLTARLITAAGTEVIEGVRGTIQSGTKNLFELLKPFTQ